MSEHICELTAIDSETWETTIGVEVVRCRNCKDYRERDATCHSWQWHNWDAPIEVDPDGFCAWGERK